MIPRSWWLAAALALLFAGALPPLATYLRGPQVARCNYDGLAVEPAFQVRFAWPDARDIRFCSLTCAELWLQASGRQPSSIWVTDEPSGVAIPLEDAHFVRSSVVVHRPTRDRRHVFADRDTAQRHAEQFFGRILTFAEQPFASSGVP